MNKENNEKLAEKIFNFSSNNIPDENEGTIDERALKVIKNTSFVCAVAAICPIPFADIFILTPIQCVMAMKIGRIYGFEISKDEAGRVIMEIGGVIGLGIMAQQIAIGLYKTIIPFYGAIVTIPMVWSLTYAIGRVIKKYYEYKQQGKTINKAEIKDLFEQMKKEGKNVVKDVDVQKVKNEAKKLWDNINNKRVA